MTACHPPRILAMSAPVTDLVKIVILAVVQGLTEFLPVSSSGHLGLGQHLLGLDAPGLFLEVTTHAGTLLAVIVFYRKRLAQIATGCIHAQREAFITVGLLLLGIIPVGIIGILAQARIEALFNRPHVIAAMLICTGILLLSLYRKHEASAQPITVRSATLIGLAQAAALLPGMSRSGTTITIARHLGIAPREAAEFSLLMMIPAIGGAILLSLREAATTGIGTLDPLHLLIAFAVSAFVGYGAIGLLVRTLSHGHFRWFGFYCLTIGLLALVLL